MLGLRLAGLYSLPPCRLGYCGQKIKNASGVLDNFLKGEEKSLPLVRKALEAFEAAYPYYRLIARSNFVGDPFDRRVVEAYWLGNSLLEKVTVADIRDLILKEFAKPGLLSPKEAQKRIKLVPPGARPHHSFHVFILGSITGRVKLVGKLRDICRIGWGRVSSTSEVSKGKVIVNYQPLIRKNGRLSLGQSKKKKIAWKPEFIPEVKKGDVVSFHWDRVCQVLNKRQQKNLQKYTQINIEALNSINEPRR